MKRRRIAPRTLGIWIFIIVTLIAVYVFYLLPGPQSEPLGSLVRQIVPG